MCGRFSLAIPMERLVALFQRPGDPEPRIPATLAPLLPRYNIAPTQQVPVIRGVGEGRRQVAFMRWGLVPSWAKELKIGAKMINARAETLAEKPSFRQAFKRRRCLIPTTGFFEWRREGEVRRPHLIRLADGRPFVFASLWERWEGDMEGVVESCTIITTSPTPEVAEIHDRMPVILPESRWQAWLDEDTLQADGLSRLLQPYDEERLEIHPVSRKVNNPRNDLPECLDPLPN